MSKVLSGVLGIVLLLALVLVLNSSSQAMAGPLAQEPLPPDSVDGTMPGSVTLIQPEGVEGVSVNVSSVIPIQGRLTDAGGNPIDGTKSITFSLYTVSSGGTPVCLDNDSISVDNGLFYANIDYCGDTGAVNGQRLYLGIHVAGEAAEMTPRRAIYPVPYALSLAPGAVISGGLAYSGDYGGAMLTIINDEGRGLYVERLGSGSGAAGYFVNHGTTSAVYAENNSSGDALYLKNNTGPFVTAVSSVGSTMFSVRNDGSVSQSRAADGLVKAAVYAICSNTSSSISRYFNNAGGAITIANGASAGRCTIDFGFQINDRYFVAAPVYDAAARGVTCNWGADSEKLDCFRFDGTDGTGVGGEIMVTIY